MKASIIIVLISLNIIYTACRFSPSDFDLLTDPSILLTVNNAHELQVNLSRYRNNTADNPITVYLNVSDLGGTATTRGSIANIIYYSRKYINLDMSGSTIKEQYQTKIIIYGHFIIGILI